MIAFTRSAVYFQELIGSAIDYPCLCLSFGTGAAASENGDITNIMLYLVNQNFYRLRDAYRRQTGTEPISGSHMGKSFFRWIQEKHPTWDEESIACAFQERCNALIQDLQEFLSNQGIDCQTVLIGGGNSRYLSLRNFPDSQVATVLLNPQYFTTWGISPDLCTLIGALPTAFTPNCKVQSMPPLEEVYDLPKVERKASSFR